MPRNKDTDPLKTRFTPKDRDLPATQGMLQLVRTELKSEMRAGFKKVDARFAQMEGRFAQMEGRFAQIDERFARIDEQFALVHSGMAELTAQVSRIALAVEEQNSRNKIVMDALSGLWTRQDRVEQRMDGFEKWLLSLPRGQ